MTLWEQISKAVAILGCPDGDLIPTVYRYKEWAELEIAKREAELELLRPSWLAKTDKRIVEECQAVTQGQIKQHTGTP